MKRAFQKIASKFLLQPWFRLNRGLTLGVRGLVRNAQGDVLLVQHTYVSGWMFPGGGVERGETAQSALTRELQEEVGVIIDQPPQLFGLYANDQHFRGDHVVLFVVNTWTQSTATSKFEIKDKDFFALDNLPVETTPATRARLDEVFSDQPIRAEW